MLAGTSACDSPKDLDSAHPPARVLDPNGPSTANLSAIPAPAELKRIGQSLAVIDRLLEDRFSGKDPVDFDFNESFEGEVGGSVFLLETEAKDKLWIWFGDKGVVIKGSVGGKETDPTRSTFVGDVRHGYRLSRGMLEGFPEELNIFLKETVFTPRDATFFIWRLNKDSAWHTGNALKNITSKEQDPDGSLELLSYINPDPKLCLNNFRHKHKTAARAASRIFMHEPLTQTIIDELGGKRRIAEVADEMKLINYPIAE